MIARVVEKNIRKQLFKKKSIIILGPRQSGKTTLLKNLLKDYSKRSLFLNGDDPAVIGMLSRPNTEELQQIIGKNTILLIDEAQRIPDIGITAKIIHDTFTKVQLILSGSSAFELASKTQESLTGRKRTFYLWPISFQEFQEHYGYLKAEQDLENRLVYGFYPEVLTNTEESEILLREISDSYLYKDILMYGNLKKPAEIQNLLKALSFQIGNEVSYRELGQTCGLDPKTVERYIDILEKAYVVFRLPSFSRNLRNEIKAGRKIYFFDNGIRNAVIAQYQTLNNRNDKGALWENFLISERMKYLAYNSIHCNSYFWRTTQQQEIDYIEERNGKISAFEFKFSEQRKIRFSKSFLSAYNPTIKGIHRKNYKDFIVK